MGKPEGGIDKSLADGLKRARKLPADRPYFFALVVKGASAGKLIVSKKKIPTKDIAAAKKETGGSAVVKGVCFGEGGQLVFETVKPPAPAWTALTKKLAKDDAGLAIKPVFRLGRDDEQVAETDAPEDEAPEDEADEVVEPDPAVARAKEAAAWQKRVDAVTVRVKAAAVAKHPQARDMALGVSQVGAYFRGGKPADAEARLKEVEALLDAAAPPKAPPPPPQAGDPAAEWKAKLAEYQPAIKAAVAGKGPTAGEIGKLFAQATALAKPGGDMAQALERLRECHARATATAGGTSPPPTAIDAAVKRVNGLGPAIKAALVAGGPNLARVQALARDVHAAVRAGAGDAAGRLLDELEPLLAARPGPDGTPPPPAEASVAGRVAPNVALQQSRLAWDAARKRVAAELAKLRQGITSLFAGRSEAAEVADAAGKLDLVLETFDGRLSDKLDEALNAADPEARLALQAEAARLLRQYRAVLERDPLLLALDDNPVTPVAVRKTLLATVDLLRKKLRP